ncbi:MAG: PQQ-like beta-propeller repeat protein [Saprospiraceae bacterium]|nr:PQQ-like beta-propeller repeat protein [Saprospiraceae bacterium]
MIFFSIRYFSTRRLENWTTMVSGVASSASSPRVADLNHDGVKDIVIGSGGREYDDTENGVLAINGKTGQILWKMAARNQVVGSAVFQDINNDEIPDVFIGGRSAIFYALDGKNGTLLWEYLPDTGSIDFINDTSILNFHTPQFIPDLDSDGHQDLLTAYGGFVKARPGDTLRPSGYLMILSAATGKVISQASMPDRRETYLSPLVFDFENSGTLEVIFGTGGEDIDGRLYRARLSDLMENDLSKAVRLAEGNGKGFIAPPLLIDVNRDHYHDIVVNSVDGRLICVDGRDNRTLWESSLVTSFDTYTVPAPGYFVGDDSIPDFFSSFGKGPWPNTAYTVHTMTNGLTGQIVYRDTLGTFQYASPIVYDIDHDQEPDVLVVINTQLSDTINGREVTWEGNNLMVYPQGSRPPFQLGSTLLGSNLGATPLITDLDGNGRYELIRTSVTNQSNLYALGNLLIELKQLAGSQENIYWNGYMGLYGNSLVAE